MLCSVLIPSRGRIHCLKRTLESLKTSATSDDYEALIRFDSDDGPSIGRIAELAPYNCKIIIGPRYGGWKTLDQHHLPEMEALAKGVWEFVANDDLIVSGDWMGELAKAPTHGFICQPEISKLDESTYAMADDQAFPILPLKCWEKLPWPRPSPFDVMIGPLMRGNGWRTRFLRGVTFEHQRLQNLLPR